MRVLVAPSGQIGIFIIPLFASVFCSARLPAFHESTKRSRLPANNSCDWRFRLINLLSLCAIGVPKHSVYITLTLNKKSEQSLWIGWKSV